MIAVAYIRFIFVGFVLMIVAGDAVLCVFRCLIFCETSYCGGG